MTLDLDHLFLGIDNTRSSSLRVVCLDGEWSGNPLWCGRFHDLTKFCLTIEQFLGAGTVIATTTEPDNIGAIGWLRDRGYEPHRYDKQTTSGFFEVTRFGMTAKYRRAYQLALQARRVSELSFLASGIQSRLDALQAQLDWLKESIFCLEVPF